MVLSHNNTCQTMRAALQAQSLQITWPSSLKPTDLPGLVHTMAMESLKRQFRTLCPVQGQCSCIVQFTGLTKLTLNCGLWLLIKLSIFEIIFQIQKLVFHHMISLQNKGGNIPSTTMFMSLVALHMFWTKRLLMDINYHVGNRDLFAMSTWDSLHTMPVLCL